MDSLTRSERIVENSGKDHVRLLITIEKNEISKNLVISSHRFVFGFDLNLLRTVKELLDDLRSKLIPDAENGRTFFELFLRASTEYFVPPWSLTKDVFRNDDQIILRFCEKERKDDLAKSVPEVVEDVSEKKRKRRKRKLDEEDDFLAAAAAEKGKTEKKKKKKKNRDRESTPSAIDQKSESTKPPEVEKELESISTESSRSKKKKRRKQDTADLYDKALVIRNGNTGKIQHVYFDSSASSPISENSKADEEITGPKDNATGVAISRNGKDSGTKAAVESKKEKNAAPAKSTAELTKNQETEFLTSNSLKEAKSFVALIDQQTTCQKLNRNLKSFDAGIVNGENGSDAVPVVVTKIEQKSNEQLKGKNRYSNVSVILQKPVATSTPISSDRTQILTPTSTSSPISSDQTQISKATTETTCTKVVALPNGTNDNTEIVKESAQIWSQERIEKYPTVKHSSGFRIGDRLAYKVMELDEIACTPGISDWKIGQLVGLDLEKLELQIKLISGEARCEVPLKFRFDEEDGEMDDGEKSLDAPQQRTLEETILWREIVEARLLND